MYWKPPNRRAWLLLWSFERALRGDADPAPDLDGELGPTPWFIVSRSTAAQYSSARTT